VLRATQRECFGRLFASPVGRAGDVIQLIGLPACGLLNPSPRPPDRFLVAPELDHRLGNPDELMRSRQVSSPLREAKRPCDAVKADDPDRGKALVNALLGARG
jgi:hypothetical protein